MADENARRRDEGTDQEPDVVGHRYVTEEPGEDDPDRKRKRKRKQSEDSESGELDRKRK